MSEAEPKNSAPYGPFSTFETGLNHLAALGGIPGTVDRSVFPSMGGIAQSQTISAFKFLGLIDENGKPQPVLSELALNKETRKATLRKIIKERYPNITEADLGTMSLVQLDAKFGDKLYNVSGGTKPKARSFLLKAAEYCGIPLSRLLTAKGPRGPRKKRAAGTNGRQSATEKTVEKTPKHDTPLLDPEYIRMPIALAPDRVAHVELPKDWNEKDAKKLLALLKLSLDVND